MLAQLDALQAAPPAPCVWSEDEQGNWRSGCIHQNVQAIAALRPSQIQFTHCPYCGAVLKEADRG